MRAPFEELIVRARRADDALSGEQRELARRAALELRFGLENNDPAIRESARLLDRLVLGLEVEGAAVPHPLGATSPFLEERLRRLEAALASHRLVVERAVFRGVFGDEDKPPVLPDLPPPRREAKTTSFEVCFVDEIGVALNGLDVEFALSGERLGRTTNAAGVATLEGATGFSALVAAPEPKSIDEILDPRWRKLRPGAPPKEANTTEFLFDGGAIDPVSLKAVVRNTIVLKPPRGRIFLELWDKTGRIRHVERPYRITGPTDLRGTTDAQGRLRHDDVFPGDYELSLDLEFLSGPDLVVEVREGPLVVLDAGEERPEVRKLGVVPLAVRARLHLFFNTNKTFLLPTAMPSVRLLRELYLENSDSELLVVGHADTTGDEAFNDRLSLERAESVIAFLKDDSDAWLAFYDAPGKKRWGAAEDRMMIVSLPDFATKPKGEDAVRWFQRTRKLTIDGKAGPQTRGQLIKEYMALDGASLEESGLQINATAHGCGEHFPLDETGEKLDPAPENPKRDPQDRRVELFFFDAEFGIVPKPPGKNSAAGSEQYPKWRELSVETHDFTADDLDGPVVVFGELADAHFRTNSAVVLPEGETPTNDAGALESLTSVGLFASVLRFNEEHPGKKLLAAGHADTTGQIDFNQKLSLERADVALALLVGGDAQREKFKSLCEARHTVADYKQILAWVARAFGFPCDPGRIDEVEGTGVEPVRAFQNAYNENKPTLGFTADDLAPDGDVGPLTWGAFFDCYEFALRKELGEDEAGLARLRAGLVFVDDGKRSLGFGERFPVEELGVDNFRSQQNRRVEMLFFDPGEEPDLAASENDPETSEIYLPGRFQRYPLDPMVSALPWQASWDALQVSQDQTGIMRLVAPGLPAGTPVTWTLEQVDAGSVAELSSVSSAGKADTPNSDWVFPEALVMNPEISAEEAFPEVAFGFTAEAGGRAITARANVVYSDDLKIRLSVAPSFEAEEFPADLPYVVHTLVGSRRGKTQKVDGQDGFVVEKGLPPGGATVVIEDLEALRAG